MSDDLICSVKKLGRDLVVDSLKIAGKDPVRELIILTPSDIFAKRGGQNIYKFSYRVGNNGFMASRGFDNVTYFWEKTDKTKDKVVSRQHAMSLGPNEYKVVEDEISLEVKDGVVLTRIDAFSKIAEDNETNNEMSTNIVFKGFQKGSADPMLHVEFLRVAGRTPVQGRLTLGKKDSLGTKENRHSFQVEFVVRNYGTSPATGIENAFLLDGKRFSRQKEMDLAPGESRLVQMPVYFPIHNGAFSVQIDVNQKCPPAQGLNRSTQVQVYFQGL